MIDRLSHDLRNAFPTMKGFSSRNLKYMRALAEAYPDEEFVQQVAAQIPWFHNCVILDKINHFAERKRNCKANNSKHLYIHPNERVLRK